MNLNATGRLRVSVLAIAVSVAGLMALEASTDRKFNHVEGITGMVNGKCKYQKPCETTCAIKQTENGPWCYKCGSTASNWACKEANPLDNCSETFTNDPTKKLYCSGLMKGAPFNGQQCAANGCGTYEAGDCFDQLPNDVTAACVGTVSVYEATDTTLPTQP